MDSIYLFIIKGILTVIGYSCNIYALFILLFYTSDDLSDTEKKFSYMKISLVFCVSSFLFQICLEI